MALNIASLRGIITPPISRLAAATLGALLLGWAGYRAARAGAAHRGELRRAEVTLATFAEWRRRYEPAVAAESITWRRTLMELQALGVIGDERLALTQMVGRAAEFSGLRDVRVTIDAPDTTGSHERLSTEGVRRQSAPFGLVVECRGNLQAVVNFLGELPPSVAPTNFHLVRQDGRARHRLSLAVYELQLSNGPPGPPGPPGPLGPLGPLGPSGPYGTATLWSPLERGDHRRIGVSRVRG